MKKNKILVTGCAGFIGYHLSINLVKDFTVIGIDSINNYYDIKIKKQRLNNLIEHKNFKFNKINLTDQSRLEKLFKIEKFDYVVNLAAQAGVRYSIENPKTYLDNNIVGFFNLIDLSKKFNIKHFLYASTSSVYGDTKKFPISEHHNTDKPLSFYAASKKCNEIMAHSYSAIFKLPTTGLRFFTVYGPMGRPDMALFKFVSSAINGRKADLFNHGNHVRDFTYINDVVSSIRKLIHKKPKNDTPYEIFNVGSGDPKKLSVFINLIEKYISKKINFNFLELQKGDVHKTHSDNSKLQNKIGKIKFTNIKQGIKNFVDWYSKSIS